jgi:hypothetical protein
MKVLVQTILEKIESILLLSFYSKHYHSAALESKCLVTDSPGILKSAAVHNKEVTDLYLLVFDASAEPADQTAPLSSWFMPANTVGNFEFNQKMGSGIYFGLSTTEFTFTDAAADANFNVEYTNTVK